MSPATIVITIPDIVWLHVWVASDPHTEGPDVRYKGAPAAGGPLKAVENVDEQTLEIWRSSDGILLGTWHKDDYSCISWLTAQMDGPWAIPESQREGLRAGHIRPSKPVIRSRRRR